MVASNALPAEPNGSVSSMLSSMVREKAFSVGGFTFDCYELRSNAIDAGESSRHSWRLHALSGWSDAQIESMFSRVPGASRDAGLRAATDL